MMTAGAGVVIWAIIGVMMPGMITGGHHEGTAASPGRSRTGRLSEVAHARHFDQERGYEAGRHPDKSRTRQIQDGRHVHEAVAVARRRAGASPYRAGAARACRPVCGTTCRRGRGQTVSADRAPA
jgi:hypothetical protein